MRIHSTGFSDIGNIRENNEDNIFLNGNYKKNVQANMFFCEDNGEYSIAIFAVADGMGGTSKGEVAARGVVEPLCYVNQEKLWQNPKNYFLWANQQVCKEMLKRPGCKMGTTLSLLLIKEHAAKICHIGDSRIYRYRNGCLKQLTKDHTQAQQLVDFGMMTEAEAKISGKRNVLTQHLGVFPQEFIIGPQVIEDIDIVADDFFLLCSDGLTEMLDDAQIRNVIYDCIDDEHEKIADRLVHTACERGGKDNVSVIVIKIF